MMRLVKVIVETLTNGRWYYLRDRVSKWKTLLAVRDRNRIPAWERLLLYMLLPFKPLPKAVCPTMV